MDPSRLREKLTRLLRRGKGQQASRANEKAEDDRDASEMQQVTRSPSNKHMKEDDSARTQAEMNDLSTKSTESLCRRCSDIDFVGRLTLDGNPWKWWFGDYDTLGGSQNYVRGHVPTTAYSLGERNTIPLNDACPACRVLKLLVTRFPCDAMEELFLVSTCAIERKAQRAGVSDQNRPRSGQNWAPEEPSDISYAKILHLAKKFEQTQEHWTFAHEAREALVIADVPPNVAVSISGNVKKGVNFDQLGNWVTQCIISHKTTCPTIHEASKLKIQNISLVDMMKKIRVIDVVQRRVVPYVPRCIYFCLSYVWGDVRQRSQGLGDLPDRLLATIEDAIEIVRRLSQRYLWVDSLCIEQENNTHKEEQIGLMCPIYQGAWATIIALTGRSADDGIPCIRNGSNNAFQECFRIGDTSFVTVMPTLEQQISHSTWKTRAWTFQEGHLSPRCLYFAADQVYFECLSMQCCDSVHEWEADRALWNDGRRLVTQSDKFRLDMIERGTFRSGSLNLHDERTAAQLYDSCIREYNTRSLTNDSDAINAINGILLHLQQIHPSQFGSGFFWGLPLDTLALALTWYGRGSFRPRKEMPTWSWAYHRGPLTRVIMVAKDLQRGPHQNGKYSSRPLMSFGSKYFITFYKLGDAGFEAVYMADPPRDPILDQNNWGNTRSLVNLWYNSMMSQSQATSGISHDAKKMLFVDGLVFRPWLSQLTFALTPDEKSPPEEFVFKLNIAGHPCLLTCYTEEMSEHILTTHKKSTSEPLCLLILHREFHNFRWFYDMLLLDYRDDFVTRIGPMKLSFPSDEREDIILDLQPHWAKLAIV